MNCNPQDTNFGIDKAASKLISEWNELTPPGEYDFTPLEPIPATAEPRPTWTPAEFNRFTPIRWLINPVLKQRGLYSVFGAPGLGKSAFSENIAQAVISELYWAGFKVSKEEVLIITLEGQESGRDRVYINVQARNVGLGKGLHFDFSPANIGKPEDIDCIAATALRLRAKLIIIDPMSASLAGELDENSNRDMAKLISELYRLIRMTGATVLLVHHTGHHGARERGASALRANIDGAIMLTRKGSEIEWELVKTKDAPPGIGGRFVLTPIEGLDAHGEWKKSITVKHLGPIERSAATQASKGRLTENQAMVLDAVRGLLSAQQRISTDDDSSPARVTANSVVTACRGKFQSAEPKHRSSRVRDALKALTLKGYLIDDAGHLRLAD